MHNPYLDIHLSVPPDDMVRDLLPSLLVDLGFEGFLEDDRGIHCFIQKSAWLDSIETDVEQLSRDYNLPAIPLIGVTEIPGKNWNEEWERSIQPIQITERIIITPSWHPVNDPNKLVLTIDPKMTFGTGYHESTRLMLRLLERHSVPNGTVLDVGTGTGILAIAAIKLGAASAVAIDIDPLTLDNGAENAERNNVADRIDIRIGSMECVHEQSFDLILANIIKNTIIELMDDIVRKVSPSGTVLFAGLLTEDRESIAQQAAQRGFTVAEVLQENNWIGMAVRRS
jgi:ribosomal protein L11 methyltransferase